MEAKQNNELKFVCVKGYKNKLIINSKLDRKLLVQTGNAICIGLRSLGGKWHGMRNDSATEEGDSVCSVDTTLPEFDAAPS